MTDVSSAVESANLGAGANSGQKPDLLIASDKTTFLDRFSDTFSEFCSSILVKETRQAVKSRQFIWSYIVLLVAVGFWTTFVLALNQGDQVGRALLNGFLVILGFPLSIIIPFSAYRSLAREFEDGTIQLISITTMRPYQIVIGKFGSAMLQMLIYLSVLAPCILFTYMLRGTDLTTLLFSLLTCVGGSVCLTILGLFLAGAFRSRTLGIGVSVLFVLGLGFAYFGWCAASVELTWQGLDLAEDYEISVALFGIYGCVISTAALLLVAAASQISFPSDNRSTPIRLMMLVQQAVFIAFAIFMLPTIVAFQFEEGLIILLFVAGHYWLIMGFLLSGESNELSRRVRRSLPKTILSKSVFGLLMPGAGRGFLFAVANVWACGIWFMLIGLFGEQLVNDDLLQQFLGRRGGGAAVPPNFGFSYEAIIAMAMHCFFVTFFLSANFLFVRMFLNDRTREWAAGLGPFISLVTGVVFVLMMTLGTALLHVSMTQFRARGDASFALAINWYWVSFESAFGTTFVTVIHWFFFFALVAIGIIVFALVVASRELLYRPVAVPERVVIETSKARATNLPKGESIEEIFGELKPRGSE